MVADRVADSFVIPLGYGTHVDWLRNVLASKRATIVSQGLTYQVVEPEIVDAATILPAMSPMRRRIIQIKNAAYAWRQAIFLLSFCEPSVQLSDVSLLRDETLAAGIGNQFRPAIDGLAHRKALRSKGNARIGNRKPRSYPLPSRAQPGTGDLFVM